LRGSLLRRFKHYALTRADAVTVNSSASKAAILEITEDINRLAQIPMGITVAQVDRQGVEISRLRRSLLKGKNVLLMFVGRLVEEKGIRDFIDAVMILRQRGVDLRAVVVGEGPERVVTEQYVRDIGIESAVTFAGWIQRDFVYKYLAAADIFVGPSRTSKEGWKEAQGLTFLEAMCTGTPVIATKSGGIADFVKHEETGLLVDEGSPEQIAVAVTLLLNNRALYDRLSMRARIIVAKNYSRAATATAFSELFTELLRNPPRAVLGSARR